MLQYETYLYRRLVCLFSQGFQSKELIVKGNLILGDVDQFPTIDVTIDGADELRIAAITLGTTGCKSWFRQG